AWKSAQLKTASQPFWRRSRERDADGAGFWDPHLIFGLELSCSSINKENRRLENTSAISREIGDGQYIVFFKERNWRCAIYRLFQRKNQLFYGDIGLSSKILST